MTINTRRLRRTAAGLLAGLVASGIVAISPAGSASALPAGSPPSGGISIIGSSLNSGSTWGLQFDQANSYCNGDGTAGYRWHTFIVPAATDPATLTFAGTGNPVSPTGGYAQPLRNTAGTPIRAQAPTTVNGSEGFINLPTNLTFSNGAYGSTVAGSPAGGGSFWIGVACTAESAAGENVEYWSTMITATPQAGAGANNFTFIEGAPEAAPTAPTVTASQSGANTVQASWTAPTANPAVSSYDATLKQGTTVIATQNDLTTLSTSFTGVANGTGYTVEVVATNTVGDSPAGVSSPFDVTAGAQGQPTLTVVPGANAGELLASWTTPSGLTPSGYTLAVSTGGTPITGSPFAAGTNSHLATGLTAGTVYDFQVTATYTDTSAVATPSAVVSASPASADTLQQVIQVERPAGALILTQRCGVHGALDAEAVDAGFPGFPAVDALAADTTDPSAPVLVSDGTTPDPEYTDYPFANPDVPTRCVIDLGTAELLTSGDLAGQYYAASGALNEVTVVDTRQGDNGWTVTGSIASLSSGPAVDQTFSGDLVGWTPKVSATSDPVAAGEYDQIVTAGARVVPGTTGGLSAAAGQVLADAPAGSGLGIAVLDARIKILIPVENATGLYSGTLSINAA